MRSNLELLKVLFRYFHNHKKNLSKGICSCTYFIYRDNLISYDEFYNLTEYLESKYPKRSFTGPLSRYRNFCFDYGDWKVRYEFVRTLIENYDEETIVIDN